jgi:hypothetical protein
LDTSDLLTVIKYRIKKLLSKDNVVLRDVLLKDVFYDLPHVNFNRAFSQFLENYPEITCGKFYQMSLDQISMINLFGRHKFTNMVFAKSVLYLAFKNVDLEEYRVKRVQTTIVLYNPNKKEDVKPKKIKTRSVKRERGYKLGIKSAFNECLEEFKMGVTTQYAVSFFGYHTFLTKEFKALTLILEKYPYVKLFDLLLLSNDDMMSIEGMSDYRNKKNMKILLDVIMEFHIEDPRYLEKDQALKIATSDQIKDFKKKVLILRKSKGL